MTRKSNDVNVFPDERSLHIRARVGERYKHDRDFLGAPAEYTTDATLDWCVECGVEIPKERNSRGVSASMGTALDAANTRDLYTHRYYCDNCHSEWPRKVDKFIEEITEKDDDCIND